MPTVLAVIAAVALVVDPLAPRPTTVVGSWVVIAALVGLGSVLFSGTRIWRLVALVGALYMIGMSALELAAPTLAVRLQHVTTAVIALLLLLGVVSGVGVVLRPIRRLRRTRLARLDLEDGLVSRFEGTLGPDFDDVTLERLLAQGYLDRAVRSDQRLELLPRSSLVVRANGRLVEPLTEAHVARLAPPELHALRIDLPRNLIRIEHDPGLSIKRRSLSPAERDELEAHVEHLRGRYAPSLAVTLITMVVAAAQALEPDLRDGSFAVASIGWYVLAFLTYVGYARRVLAARRLAWDRELHWVVTVHDRGSTGEEDTPKLEVLPISQLAWTEDTKPAAWRAHSR